MIGVKMRHDRMRKLDNFHLPTSTFPRNGLVTSQPLFGTSDKFILCYFCAKSDRSNSLMKCVFPLVSSAIPPTRTICSTEYRLAYFERDFSSFVLYIVFILRIHGRRKNVYDGLQISFWCWKVLATVWVCSLCLLCTTAGRG